VKVDIASLPTRAYIPGKTERHPEGLFDPVRQTVSSGMTSLELAASPAFLSGIAYMDAGFYWEAHELFEPVWMALPEGSGEQRFVQALIQLANAHLKLNMGREKAAMRLCGIVRDLLPDTIDEVIMSVSVDKVLQQISSVEHELGKLQ